MTTNRIPMRRVHSANDNFDMLLTFMMAAFLVIFLFLAAAAFLLRLAARVALIGYRKAKTTRDDRRDEIDRAQCPFDIGLGEYRGREAAADPDFCQISEPTPEPLAIPATPSEIDCGTMLPLDYNAPVVTLDGYEMPSTPIPVKKTRKPRAATLKPVEMKTAPKKPRKAAPKPAEIDLEKLTVAALREKAKQGKVKGYSRMKKAELIRAIREQS